MGERDASTLQKVNEWIWHSAESFLGGLATPALAVLILGMFARAGAYLLSIFFGIETPKTTAGDVEFAVVLLAVIVVPVLMRILRILDEIARVLGEIARRTE